MQGMRRSTIREILKMTKRKEIISFAGGLPAPELFPIRDFSRALQELTAAAPVSLHAILWPGRKHAH